MSESASVGATGPAVLRPSGSPLLGPVTETATRLAADRLFELTIKFVGTVGVSILRLRRQDGQFSLLPPIGGQRPSTCARTTNNGSESFLLDGGIVSPLEGMPREPGARVVYGSLELENVTKALPLTYRLTGGDEGGNRGIVYHTQREGGGVDNAHIYARLCRLPAGCAELMVLAEETGTLPPGSRCCLQYCIIFHAFQGVFQRSIVVENVSSSGLGVGDTPAMMVMAPMGIDAPVRDAASPPLSHRVRLFVDDGAVLLNAALFPSETSTTLMPSFSRPWVSSGTVMDSTDEAVLALGSATPPPPPHQRDNEGCLEDERKNALLSLETLSLPLTVTVGPSRAVATPGVGDDGSFSPNSSPDGAALPTDATVGDVDGREGPNSLSLSRFRILPTIVAGEDANASFAHDDLDQMHEIEEHGDAENADEDDHELPNATCGSVGVGGNFSCKATEYGKHRRWNAVDSRHREGQDEDEEEDPRGLVYHLTNALDHAVVLAPYSNLPILVRAMTTGDDSADEDEPPVGLFEFDSSGSLGYTDGDTIKPSSIGSAADVEDTMNNSHADAVFGEEGLPVVGAEAEAKADGVQDDHLMRCGPTFTLAAGTTAVVRLSIRTGALTQPLPTAAVEGGQNVPFDGLIAMARIDGVSHATIPADFDWQNEPEDKRPTMTLREQVGDSVATSTNLTALPAQPTLMKLIKIVGTYCRPRFEVVGTTVVDLGHVGHTASKRGRRRFEVRLRNRCDTPVPVSIVGVSQELEVMADATGRDGQADIIIDKPIASRRKHSRSGSFSNTGGGFGGRHGDIVAYADASGGSGGAPSSRRRRGADRGCTGVVWISARRDATLVFQLRLSRRRQSWAGSQTFGARLVNLADPSAEEIAVDVLAHVVTKLVSIIGLDEVPPSPILLRLLSPGTPTFMGPSIRRRTRSSSIEGYGSFSSSEGGSLRLAPLAIPPLRGAAGRCAGSFQVKNVSGETVSVTLRVTPAPEVAGVLYLGASLQQQDSSTGVYASAGTEGRPSPSVALLPGDLLDVNAECLALPGVCLPLELLPPPLPPTEIGTPLSHGGGSREPLLDWAQPVRLMGTVRVEIALEDNPGEPDGMGDGRPRPGEGVLIESVALVGSLVPGPTFGVSCASVTLALRPPENGGGGGGGGGHGDGIYPYEPEGPASFFVESFSQSLGPVRFKITGGGRLHLARGVRVPAAEDEGGGRRRPARVVKMVTVVAEPARGTVPANQRREVVVRLCAAVEEDGEDIEEEKGLQGKTGHGDGEASNGSEHNEGRGALQQGQSAAVRGRSGVDTGIDEEDHYDLFVSVADADHPGYPPQVITVHVDVPAVLAAYGDQRAGGLGMGLPGTVTGAEGGPVGLLAEHEHGARGSYGMSNGSINDSLRLQAGEDSSQQTGEHSRTRQDLYCAFDSSNQTTPALVAAYRLCLDNVAFRMNDELTWVEGTICLSAHD